MGGDNFLQQFMAGWQMGQQRQDAQRAQQQMALRQQEAERRAQQEAEAFQLQKEEFALRKKQLQAAEAEHEFNMRMKLAAQTPRFEQVGPAVTEDLGGATPQAPSAGVLEMGPTMQDRGQMTGTIPGTNQEIPLPMLEDIIARQEAETQRQNRAALGLEKEKLALLEPYKIADDERAAKLAAQRDAATDARYQRRVEDEEKKRKGNATKLRTEYNQQLKPYLQEIDQFNKAKSLSMVPDEARTPADDIALVFLFMKAQDPGSTVREGEYATAKNAAGVPERVRNAYNQALKGVFLTPEQRSAFAKSIERNFEAGPGARVAAIQRRYDFLARDAGIDPSLVLMESGILGGDAPSDSDSGWETVSGHEVRRKVR